MARSRPALPAVFYASQSGSETLDQDDEGGNPFASALIELLGRPSLSYSEFCSGLITLTKEKSNGFQVPDVAAIIASNAWRIKPFPASAKRVALVFVYSNYRKAGVTSLPGAQFDMRRVATALQTSGFEVDTVIDPSKNDLRAALEKLAKRSENAEAALFYLTGHGFEHNGEVYLMPNNYPFKDGPGRLSELAVHVPSLANYLKAKRANLVFYGGCRTPW